jgi:hypothetical protein
MAYHLAQLNVGRLRAPIDDPRTSGFVRALDPVNATADAAPGFVWRLQTEDGNATAIRTDPDPLFLVNLSVWASLEDLAAFVYDGLHQQVMRQRRTWFERTAESIFVLWWVPAGTVPTVEEALDRLARLRRDGPTADAFTFRRPFPAPDDEGTAPVADESWDCRA